jgi:hypothetical protein
LLTIKNNEEGVLNMNKVLIIVGLVLVAVIALGTVGYAYAQTPNPQPQPFGQGMGRGRMGGGMMGGGMMGGRGINGAQTGTYGPMHEYMEAAFAEALGMSEADVEAALAAGTTMWQLAQDKGMSIEDFQKVMTEARAEALKKMVDDGTLTQEQADWMLSRMGGRGGQGGCPGMGGDGSYGPGRGPGGRWNAPQTTPEPSTNS